MLSEEEKRDFFISYTQDDTPWAELIAETLTRHGHTVYLQSWNIRPGDDFVTRMNEFLEQSRNFIAVWSEAYSQSGYCIKELNTAFRQQMNGEMEFIFPVRVQKAPLDPLFGTIVAIDLFDLNEGDAEQALLDGVGRQNRQPTDRRRKKEAVSPKSDKDDKRRPGCSVSIVVSFLFLILTFLSIHSVLYKPAIEYPDTSGAGSGNVAASPNHPSLYRIAVYKTSNGIVKTSAIRAESGRTITINIRPDDGYTLDSVIVRTTKGRSVPVRGGINFYTFTMPSAAVTVRATFIRLLRVQTIPVDFGWLEVRPEYNVRPRTEVTLIAHPEEGYQTESFRAYDETGNKIEITDNGDGTATFIMPCGDVAVLADFEPIAKMVIS